MSLAGEERVRVSRNGENGDIPEFLSGGGEMGARMRAHDWSAPPLGVPETWPQSLRTVVRILLTSRYQMWMGWGDTLSFFYNDAYRPTLGVKHAWALGASAREVWKEIWPDIGPRIEHVLKTGEATWDEGLLLFLERSGYSEETYHTFSYSPCPTIAAPCRHALRCYRGDRADYWRAPAIQFAGACFGDCREEHERRGTRRGGALALGQS
jgi:hypothetical protein